MLQVISLAQYAFAYTRSWAADCPNGRMREKAGKERAEQEIVLRGEVTRIKDARMARIDPHRRPQYLPAERLAILEIKAARGWSLEQTAKTFLVTPATIASWMKRLDEQGPEALVQLPGEPLNKFPQFVRHAVQRLKTRSTGATARRAAEQVPAVRAARRATAQDPVDVGVRPELTTLVSASAASGLTSR